MTGLFTFFSHFYLAILLQYFMLWIFLSYNIISYLLLKPVMSALLFSSHLADYLASFIGTEQNPSRIKSTYLSCTCTHILCLFSYEGAVYLRAVLALVQWIPSLLTTSRSSLSLSLLLQFPTTLYHYFVCCNSPYLLETLCSSETEPLENSLLLAYLFA